MNRITFGIIGDTHHGTILILRFREKQFAVRLEEELSNESKESLKRLFNEFDYMIENKSSLGCYERIEGKIL